MNIVCVGDIHIETKRDFHWESQRITALSKTLLEDSSDSSTLHLLGDVFDRNNPTMGDIHVFYKMIDSLAERYKTIRIIAGNHDTTCFKFLPKLNYEYLNEPTVIDQMLFLGHPFINTYKLGKRKHRIAFSHARCNIAPYIKEEIDFDKLATYGDIVILGDIHHPVDLPQKNIYYTLEPNQTKFIQFHKNTTGYLVVDTDTLEVTRRFTNDLPKRQLLVFNSVAEAEEVLKETRYPEDLLKIRVTDTIGAISRMPKAPHITYDLQVILDKQKDDTSIIDELKDIVNQKMSLEDVLMVHTQETYKFLPEVISRIKSRLRKNR